MINKFREYLTNQSKSAKTIQSYTYEVGKYFDYVKEVSSNSNPSTVPSTVLLERSHIFNYKTYLQQTKSNNAKTINRILSALKSYNEFLIKQNQNNQQKLVVLSTDYVHIQKQNLSPTSITTKEATDFITKIKNNESYRNYAIVTVICNTGLRISEVLNLKLNDLKDIDNNEATIIGKGNKQRDLIVYPEATRVIKEYLNTHRSKCKYATTSPYLFVSNKGDKIHTSTIQRIFNNYSTKITPHSLRHVFATFYLKQNNNDIVGLQEQLGHSDISTTRIYLHPTKEDRKMNMGSMCIGG